MFTQHYRTHHHLAGKLRSQKVQSEGKRNATQSTRDTNKVLVSAGIDRNVSPYQSVGIHNTYHPPHAQSEDSIILESRVHVAQVLTAVGCNFFRSDLWRAKSIKTKT